MSEPPPLELEPVAPRKRRRWVVGFMLLVFACEGVWWFPRLTSEEHFLVGKWTATAQLADGSTSVHDWEFLSSRQIMSNGALWNWTARNGQFTLQERRPTGRVLWDWVESGCQTWWYEAPTLWQMKITNPDEASIMSVNQVTGKIGASIKLIRVRSE